MAVKDFDTSENTDTNKKASEDLKKSDSSRTNEPDSAKGTEATETKNAHASGTGTIGRTESSLPGEDQIDNKQETPY